MTITHISEREQALQRENERYLKTINIQGVTIEAQQEEIAEYRKKYNDTYTALDDCARELAALKAQPVQEPVAWHPTEAVQEPCAWANDSWLSNPYGGHFRAVKSETFNRPLYAAPVQPAPLTDAQIDELAGYAFSDYAWQGTSAMMTHFARAIEATIFNNTTKEMK